MKVKQIRVSYTKTVQVKRYEPVVIQMELTAEVDEGEEAGVALHKSYSFLKKKVESAMTRELDTIYHA